MTLGELLNTCYEVDEVQVCEDWNVWDAITFSSPVLESLADKKVKAVGAAGNGVIKVELQF